MSERDLKRTTTETLLRVEHSDDQAAASLLPVVYDELRRLAVSYLRRERPEHTLQATDLVHEAYSRLVDDSMLRYRDRNHFLAVGARAMRRVLVDHARRRNRAKRRVDRLRVSLSEAATDSQTDALDVLALDEALEQLKQRDERGSRVVELRFFGGLTVRECAAVLDVSCTTVEDDWSFARAWLSRQLGAKS